MKHKCQQEQRSENRNKPASPPSIRNLPSPRSLSETTKSQCQPSCAFVLYLISMKNAQKIKLF